MSIDNSGYKLLGLDTLVTVKLTDRGYEHLENYFLTRYKVDGYDILRRFRETSMYGKIISTTLSELMLIFGSEMMEPSLFESYGFVMHESHLKDIQVESSKLMCPDEVVLKMSN